MKFLNDLTRDVRYGDYRDDLDEYRGQNGTISHLKVTPPLNMRNGGSSFSPCNKKHVTKHIMDLGQKCRCIVEIGVDRKTVEGSSTSTNAILEVKPPGAIYIGVDIQDKSYINSTEKNIYTIKTDSSDTEKIISKCFELGRNSIDFLFIDGWHSINQVCQDWELTRILSGYGVVGFHDTAYHPGPHLFIRNLDRSRWNVVENCCEGDPSDFGVGFASPKQFAGVI